MRGLRASIKSRFSVWTSPVGERRRWRTTGRTLDAYEFGFVTSGGRLHLAPRRRNTIHKADLLILKRHQNPRYEYSTNTGVNACRLRRAMGTWRNGGRSVTIGSTVRAVLDGVSPSGRDTRGTSKVKTPREGRSESQTDPRPQRCDGGRRACHFVHASSSSYESTAVQTFVGRS